MFLSLFQIRLEGIKDTVSTREADLANRREQLCHQTEAVLSDIKTKFDLFFLEQKRELSAKLEHFVGKEKTRLNSVRDQVAELTKSSQRLSTKLNSIDGGGGLSVKDLVSLDRVQDELRRHEQVVEKLRKDCSLAEIHFYPDSGVEKLFKGLTLGTLTTTGRRSEAVSYTHLTLPTTRSV